MGTATVYIFLLVLLASLLFGLAFTYLFMTVPKECKKKQINDLLSYILNLVIFIWIGKVIANLSIFLSDPLAVLAYPSNANALYIALVLFILHLLYEHFIKGKVVLPTLPLLLPLFISTAFMYEFLQLTVLGNKTHWVQVLVYAGLIVIYLLCKEESVQRWLTIFAWLTMQLYFTFVYSYTLVFQYTFTLIFILILFVIAMLAFILERKYWAKTWRKQ